MAINYDAKEEVLSFALNDFPELIQKEIFSTLDVNGFVVDLQNFRVLVAKAIQDALKTDKLSHLVLEGNLTSTYRDEEHSLIGLNFKFNSYRISLKNSLSQAEIKSKTFKFDPNSTINEGRWRLRDPQAFEHGSFKRWTTWAGVEAPEGAVFLVGQLKNSKKMALQALRFSKDIWDEESADKFWNQLKDKPGFEKLWSWDMMSERKALIAVRNLEKVSFHMFDLETLPDSPRVECEKSVSIDLDGTLAYYDRKINREVIGEPLPGALEAVTALKKEGFEIIIFSLRASYKGGFKAIKDWLDKHHFPYDIIWPGKPYSNYFIDDRGIAFKDWKSAYAEIEAREAAKQLKEVTASAPGTKDFSYSSVQIALPKEIAKEILDWSTKNIPNNILYKDKDGHGREDYPHITVKYGIHSSDATEILELLKGEKSLKLKLGKVSLFESKDKPFDVVKVEVLSDELHRLNKKISDNIKVTDTFPEYKPHVTLAYIKKGEGKPYDGNTDFINVEFTITELEFSSKEKEKGATPIILQASDSSWLKLMAMLREAAIPEQHGIFSYWIEPNGSIHDANIEPHKGHRGWIQDHMDYLVKDWGVNPEPTSAYEGQARQLADKGWIRLAGLNAIMSGPLTGEQVSALKTIVPDMQARMGVPDTFEFNFLTSGGFGSSTVADVKADPLKAYNDTVGQPRKPKTSAFMPSLPGVTWGLVDPANNSLEYSAPLENLQPVNEWNTFDSYSPIEDKKHPERLLKLFVKPLSKKDKPVEEKIPMLPRDELYDGETSSSISQVCVKLTSNIDGKIVGFRRLIAETPADKIKDLITRKRYEEAIDFIKAEKLPAPKLLEQLTELSSKAKITGADKALQLLQQGSTAAKYKAIDWFASNDDINDLLKGLDIPDAGIKLKTIDLLEKFKNIVGLQKAFKDKDDVVKNKAFKALLSLGYSDHLEEALKGPVTLRIAAYRYAVDNDNVKLAEKGLEDPSEIVRRDLYRHFADSKNPEMHKLLSKAINDPDPSLQAFVNHLIGGPEKGRPSTHHKEPDDSTEIEERLKKFKQEQKDHPELVEKAIEEQKEREKLIERNKSLFQTKDLSETEKKQQQEKQREKQQEEGKKHWQETHQQMLKELDALHKKIKEIKDQVASETDKSRIKEKQKDLNHLEKQYAEVAEHYQLSNQIANPISSKEISLDKTAIQPPTTWNTGGPWNYDAAVPLGQRDDDFLLKDRKQYYGLPNSKWRDNLGLMWEMIMKTFKPVSKNDKEPKKEEEKEAISARDVTAHCGPCTPLKSLALQILTDVNYKVPGTISDEKMNHLLKLASWLEVGPFAKSLQEVMLDLGKSNKFEKETEKLKNIILTLNDIDIHMHEGDIKPVDVPEKVK